MKLYEKFANELIELIRNGTLKGSEKLPSIRQASQRYGISQATVIEAYYLLETQGIIYAKERSGFYIKPAFKQKFKKPTQSNESTHETAVEVSDFIFAILTNLKDPDTIQLGSAFPNPKLFPIADLTKSMHKSLADLIDCPNELITDLTRGNTELIRQIALRYALSGTPIDQEEIVITNGAMEALSLSLQVLTKPGDLVAIESPAFYAVLQILERLQLKAVEIPVNAEHGLDLTALKTSLENFDIKALVLMTNFHNPLGVTLSAKQQNKLIKLIEQYQLPTVIDDVYLELYYSKNPPNSLKALDLSGLVIHCSSFSKCLAPGFRIGWAAGGLFTDQIKRIKLMSTISPSMPSQLALSHYLQHKNYDRHLQKLRYILSLSQQKMLSAIANYFPKNIAVTKPEGGYFLWIELDPSIDALALYNKALAHKISIAPGPIFSASHQFNHCIRLNYGAEWDNELENAMKTLGKIIHDMSKK